MTSKQKESYIEQLRVLTNDRLTNAQLESILKWATTLPIEVNKIVGLMDEFDSVSVYRVDEKKETYFMGNYYPSEIKEKKYKANTVLKLRRDSRSNAIRIVVEI